MLNIRYITIIGLLITSFSVWAQNDQTKTPWLELNGYIKDMQSHYFIDNFNSNFWSNQIHNRLNFKLNISSKIISRIEIRNRIFTGELPEQIPNFSEVLNRYDGIAPFSKVWIDQNNFVAHSVIDRLLIQYNEKKWTLTVGRQRINWGISDVWNANDIFNAFNYLDFDYEERPGSDAVRFQYNLKNYSQLELAYKVGSNHQTTAAALYKWNYKKYDFQALGGKFQKDIVIGGGWAGSLHDTGFKGEWSYFIPFENYGGEKTLNISMMADRTFKNDWYVSFSTLYNSSPINTFAVNGIYFNNNITAKFLFPFRWNFYGMISKAISPILSASFAQIYSPQKNTWVAIPIVSYNLFPDFDLDLISQSYFMKINSGYRNIATQINLRGRYSF